MTKLERLAKQSIKLWAPPPNLTVSEWADQYRYLSKESAAESGKWKTLPFQREPLDAVSDRHVHTVIIKSATQMLKTEVILNGIGYFIHLSPGPILVIQPRGDDAKAFSKERIAPMIRDTPKLKELVSDSKSRVGDNTIQEKSFPGGLLAITAAGSPANLARRAIRFLFCDEVDKYPATAGPEGNPISLAQKRLATFRHRKKEIRTCSPTEAGSEIDRAYEQSDQREYYVPCPFCGHAQSLMKKFQTQVRWDGELATREEQAATARYYCEECDEAWDDAARWQAVAKGYWKTHAPSAGVAGFWISELYSPWKQLSEIVLDYLKKKDKPEQLKTFINTSLAENWVEQGEAPEWELLVQRREQYPVGVVPRGGMLLTAGVDVQRDRLEVEIVAWGRNRESWSVDYRILDGKPSLPASEPGSPWKALEELRAGTYITDHGVELPISRMYVDSGDSTNDVYNWVRNQPAGRVVAVKGTDKGVLPVGAPTAVEVNVNGKKIKKGIKIRMVNVSFFKAELYADLKKRAPTEEEQKAGANYPPGFCHFPEGADYGDEHFKQLCAEQLVQNTNRRTRRTKTEWHQTRARNEALDCRVYARAAAWEMGLDRMLETHWTAIEEQILSAVPKKGEESKQPEPRPAPPARRKENPWLGNRTRNWLQR